VAIKILKSGLSIESQSDFEHEIEILSSFNHPNIVKLLGIFQTEGNYVEESVTANKRIIQR
jgi:serine/threonine protein kinase